MDQKPTAVSTITQAIVVIFTIAAATCVSVFVDDASGSPLIDGQGLTALYALALGYMFGAAGNAAINGRINSRRSHE